MRGATGVDVRGLEVALAAAPDLLVADAPTTALDMVSQRQVVEVLRRCTGPGRSALLFVTHDLAVAADLCDDDVVLEQGRVVEAGPIHEVAGSPQAPFTAALVEAACAGLRPVPAPLDGAVPREAVLDGARRGAAPLAEAPLGVAS